MAGALIFLVYDNKFILPWLVLWQVGTVAYFAIPLAMCIVELTYFRWFMMTWLPQWGKELPAARQAVREFWEQGFGREIAFLFPQVKDLALRIWDWGHDFVQRRMKRVPERKERWITRLFRGALALVRIGPQFMVYGELVTLGVIPFGWLLGIPLCRTSKVRFGFAVLVITNMAATALFAAFGYGPLYGLFRLFGWV
jgi:hypothetical protein